jgi:ABC-type nitrate/sulfonate/bicarbonate transport system substrate-binding protein
VPWHSFIRPSRAGLVPALLVALLLGACGTATPDRPDSEETLLLDFEPNAVHAGIYLAVDRGFDEAEGVELTIRRPGASTDALKLLQSGRVDAAVLDIHDLGLAQERGADLVGVMALVQRPLAAVLAEPSVRRPRDLEGRRVGVTGLPSDDAVLASVVSGDGGDPGKVDDVTIGFQAVKALLARRVAAVTGFWNVEGVALQARRPGIREFRLDESGAPSYPELVLAVSRTKLDDRPEEVKAIVRAVQRGYTEALVDPESAVQAMLSHAEGLDRDTLSAQFSAVEPAFMAGAPAFGVLDRGRLQAWARWDARVGILARPPDVERGFDFSVVGPSSRD